MSMSDFGRDLVSTIQRLSGLEARISDVLRNQDRIEAKLDDFINRLAKVEANYDHIRTSVRNEIMADIKADLTRAQVYLDLQARGFVQGLPQDDGRVRGGNGQPAIRGS